MKSKSITFNFEGSVTALIEDLTFTNVDGDIVDVSKYNSIELESLINTGQCYLSLVNALDNAQAEHIEQFDFEVS